MKVHITLLAVFVVLGLFLPACGGVSTNTNLFDDLFIDYTTSSVWVVNNAGKDVAIFKDSLTRDNLLGGVKNNDKLRIKQIDGIQVLLVISADDYASGNYENAPIMDSFIAYITDNSVTNYITDRATAGYITCVNNCPSYIEVKEPNWYGNILFTMAPNETRNVYLPAGDYTLFPSQVVVESNGSTVVALTREYLEDSANAFNVPSSGAASSQFVINPEVSPKDYDAYIYIRNDSSTGLRMVSGTSLLTTTMGYTVINGSGGFGTYQFSFPLGTPKEYQSLKFIDVFGNDVVSLNTITLTNAQNYYLIVNSDNSIQYDVTPF